MTFAHHFKKVSQRRKAVINRARGCRAGQVILDDLLVFVDGRKAAGRRHSVALCKQVKNIIGHALCTACAEQVAKHCGRCEVKPASTERSDGVYQFGQDTQISLFTRDALHARHSQRTRDKDVGNLCGLTLNRQGFSQRRTGTAGCQRDGVDCQQIYSASDAQCHLDGLHGLLGSHKSRVFLDVGLNQRGQRIDHRG